MKKLSRFSKFLPVVFLLFSACQSGPKKQEVTSDKVFPDGIYAQSVHLTVKTKDGENGIPFTSLSKIQEGKFAMKGLTPFGTKAFEARGDINNPDSVELKFHMDVPKFLKKDFVKNTLLAIQKLQKLKKKQLKRVSNWYEYENKETKLQIYSYTRSGVPREMKLSSKNPPWKAHISTSKFKPN